MKGEDLFNALSKIDDNFIDSAKPGKMHIYKRNVFKWVAGVAACLCLIVGGYSIASVLTAQDGDLPEIGYTIVLEGMGYEGTDELSLENSQDINPWNENVVLEKLPVYKNLCYNEGKLTQKYFDVLELKDAAERLADKLGLGYSNTQISISNSKEVISFSLETEKGTVRMFPKGSNITVREGDSHLIEKHMHIASENNSDAEKVTGVYSEYSIDGELLTTQTRSFYKSGNITDDIISFNMQSHYITQNGNYITGRSDDSLKGTEKLGDYPVINLQKAREKLLRGEYISTASEENVKGGRITEAVIAKADLIYYTSGNQEYYLPYYRFFVEYSQGINDIKQYAYFYVCAVDDKYLGEITVFDGSYQ